jgi:hypothetical protein
MSTEVNRFKLLFQSGIGTVNNFGEEIIRDKEFIQGLLDGEAAAKLLEDVDYFENLHEILHRSNQLPTRVSLPTLEDKFLKASHHTSIASCSVFI